VRPLRELNRRGRARAVQVERNRVRRREPQRIVPVAPVFNKGQIAIGYAGGFHHAENPRIIGSSPTFRSSHVHFSSYFL